MRQDNIILIIQNIITCFQLGVRAKLRRWKSELTPMAIGDYFLNNNCLFIITRVFMKIFSLSITKTIFFSLLILVVACSSEESVKTSPPQETSLHILFSANSININSIDSAYVLLTNGELSFKRYFEKSINSLVAPMNYVSGTWEANFFLYTKGSDSDYPRQYTQRKFLTVDKQPVTESAPTGSIIDTWYPRILLIDSEVCFLLGLSPEDRMVSVEVTAENKWDYFSISKSAHYRNGNSVLVGHVFFEMSESIQPPGILNFSDLDLDTEIADKQWNEVEIYGMLLDNESEEKPFYYRIAL